MKSKVVSKLNQPHYFGSYLFSSKDKLIFVEKAEKFKIGGQVTVLDENDLEDIEKTLNYSTAQILVNSDVVLFGLDGDGRSLVLVPQTDELDFRYHGVTGKYWLIRIHLYGGVD